MLFRSSGGIKHLLKKNKVTVFDGHAKLLGKGRVDVAGKETLAAKNIIIATGARARFAGAGTGWQTGLEL